MNLKLRIGLISSMVLMAWCCCFAQNGIPKRWPVSDPVAYLTFLPNDSFAIDTPRPVTYRHSNVTAFMNDEQDSLLFQCNGTRIVNKHLQTLENGDSLTDNKFYQLMHGWGSSITQGVLALPKKSNTYWVFYYSWTDSLLIENDASPDRLYYAVVDMDANGGAGKVVEKKVPLHKGVMGDCRLTAVRHANGRDWWMVNHAYVSNTFNKWLVTADSVYGPFPQQIGAADFEPDLIGMANFTLDGTKYACGAAGTYLNILDFDRCSGEFSNARPVKVYAEPPWDVGGSTGSGLDGVCFSPNGRYLYINTLDYLLQYDTEADTISNTRTLIAIVDSTYTNPDPFFNLFVTPTNKIMVSNFQGLPGAYHIIHHPDSAGLACQFQKEALDIPGCWDNVTLPNVVNFGLGKIAGGACDTILGIGALPEKEAFAVKVFPNPATELVYIETADYYHIATLEIIDALGQTVYRNPNFDGATAISVSAWVNGVYFWRLEGKNTPRLSGKLLVQH